MQLMLERWIHAVWYNSALSGLVLVPLSWLYSVVIRLRKLTYDRKWRNQFRANKLVVVIGNITAGGVGKTPLVVWLVERLQDQGYKPGVITRGYGGSISESTQINEQHTATDVGDEALMMAQRLSVPVVVGRSRASSAALIQALNVNIIIADDGLQHYALERDIEICVVDGQRMFGNGRLLPSGPLREPVSRLKMVDVVIKHLHSLDSEQGMVLGNPRVWQLTSTEERTLSSFNGQTVHAVAGLGNPARFFDSLERAGLVVIKHAFPDHHRFTPDDLAFGDDLAVLMTDKDAVKCSAFARDHYFAVRVDAQLSSDVEASILNAVNALDAHGSN